VELILWTNEELCSNDGYTNNLPRNDFRRGTLFFSDVNIVEILDARR